MFRVGIDLSAMLPLELLQERDFAQDSLTQIENALGNNPPDAVVQESIDFLKQRIEILNEEIKKRSQPTG